MSLVTNAMQTLPSLDTSLYWSRNNLLTKPHKLSFVNQEFGPQFEDSFGKITQVNENGWSIIKPVGGSRKSFYRSKYHSFLWENLISEPYGHFESKELVKQGEEKKQKDKHKHVNVKRLGKSSPCFDQAGQVPCQTSDISEPVKSVPVYPNQIEDSDDLHAEDLKYGNKNDEKISIQDKPNWTALHYLPLFNNTMQNENHKYVDVNRKGEFSLCFDQTGQVPCKTAEKTKQIRSEPVYPNRIAPYYKTVRKGKDSDDFDDEDLWYDYSDNGEEESFPYQYVQKVDDNSCTFVAHFDLLLICS